MAEWINDKLLNKLREVESGGRNDLVSKAGAVGEYQWLPKSAAQAGYGVKAFDPLDPTAARSATKQYLTGLQKHHGFTPEETLRAYNWGAGNVLKHKSGKRKDIPAEALNYPGKILGIENTEGVTPQGDIATPTARPGSIKAEPQALPTPRPQPDSGFWESIMKMFGYNEGGSIDLDDPTNRDSVPALLTPGEFVLNKEAVALFGPQIEKMNQAGLEARKQGNVEHLNRGGITQPIDLIGLNEGGKTWKDYIPTLADLHEKWPGYTPPAGGGGTPRILPWVPKNEGGGIYGYPSEDNWTPPIENQVVPIVSDTYEDRLAADALAAQGDILGAGHDRFTSTRTGDDYRIIPGADDNGAQPQFNKLVDSDGYRAPQGIINEYRREAEIPRNKILAESAKADEEILKELAQKELEASGTLSRDTQNKLEDAKGKTIVAEDKVVAEEVAQKGDVKLGEQAAVDDYEEYKSNAAKAGLEDVDSFEKFQEKNNQEISDGKVKTGGDEDIVVTDEDAETGTLKVAGQNNQVVIKEDGTAVINGVESQKGAMNSVFGSIKDLLGDFFGDISKKDIGRLGMVYLGGRMLGGSHEGSLKVAAKNALQYHDARLAAEAKAAAKQGYKRKSGTKTLELPNGAQHKFFEYEGPQGTSWRTWVTGKDGKKVLKSEEELTAGGVNFSKEGTADSTSKTWNTTAKNWTTNFEKIFDSQHPKDDVSGTYNLETGSESAVYSREYFKDQGYDVTNPDQLAAMQAITQQAARSAAKYAKNNPDKEVKIRPFLAREVLFSKTGASDVWVSEHDENENNIKYTNPIKVGKLDKKLKDIIRDDNPDASQTSISATSTAEWNKLRAAWSNMSESYKNSAYKPSDDESQFYVFARNILEDSKITSAELKPKGSQKKK